MLDSLKKIKEAEQKACDRIEAAQKESEAMLAKIEDEANILFRRVAEEARHRAAEMMETARIEAKAAAEKIISEGTRHTDQAKQRCSVHMAAAVKIIVSQTTGEI